MLSINNFNYFCTSKFSTKIITEMKKILSALIVIIIFCCFPTVKAQTITGSFINKRQQGKNLFLYRTEGNYKYKIDSVKINLDGSFAFPKKEYALGYYKLALSNDKNISYKDTTLFTKEYIFNTYGITRILSDIFNDSNYFK